MTLAFSTIACPDWSFAEVVGAAKRFGYQGIELRALNGSTDLLSQAEFRGTRLKESARLAAWESIKVLGLGTGVCLHSSQASERSAAVKTAIAHGAVAFALGAGFIRVFGDRVQPGATRADTECWIYDGLCAIDEGLRGSGVRVLLETHGDFAAAEQLGFLQGMSVIWDPVNPFIEHGRWPAWPAQPVVRHVHVKDARRKANGDWEFVIPGTGSSPLDEMLKQLRVADYKGGISFEWERLWHKELRPAEEVLPLFAEWAGTAGWA